MKKLLLLAMLLISSITFSQSEDNGAKPEQSFEQILKPYVEKTLNRLDNGVDIVIDEVPSLLQDYVIYKSITHWISIIISIILFIAVIYMLKYLYKQDWDGGEVATMIFGGGVGMATSLGLFFYNIYPAIQSTFFPKLYLIEQFIKIF